MDRTSYKLFKASCQEHPDKQVLIKKVLRHCALEAQCPSMVANTRWYVEAKVSFAGGAHYLWARHANAALFAAISTMACRCFCPEAAFPARCV